MKNENEIMKLFFTGEVQSIVKAWDLLLDAIEEDGIRRASQLDPDLWMEAENTFFECQDAIWNSGKMDDVIKFDQRVASFDWEASDEDKYGDSWTIESGAKAGIAEAYARKGDLEKANALFESYLQEDYARGAYWFGYINFLMDDDPDKLPLKLEELNKGIKDQKIRMADSWINDLIYNLEVSEQSKHVHFLQEILDERKRVEKQKKAQKSVEKVSAVSVEQYGKYLPKKKLKELKKKGIIK